MPIGTSREDLTTITMTSYTTDLAAAFRRHARPDQAEQMAAYMKNQYPFLGMKSPERTALLRAFGDAHGYPQGEELWQVVMELWSLPEREFQNVAMDLLGRQIRKLARPDIDRIELLITEKSWWDTVDYLASKLAGAYFQRFPELAPIYTERWIVFDHLWLRRSALLYQLNYKDKTDVERLFRYILLCADEKDFFIRKAIGWVLRQYARTDASAVRRFVAAHTLSPLSVREALKRVGARPGE